MPHEKRIEIRWSDLDAYGHVNQAVHLTYAEEVLDDWFRTCLGRDPGTIWDYVARRTTIDYRGELRLADREAVGIGVARPARDDERDGGRHAARPGRPRGDRARARGRRRSTARAARRGRSPTTSGRRSRRRRAGIGVRRRYNTPMNDLARRIQRTYLTLLLGNTLAASFIWGINTLFLLDAGLSNLEAFAANAFFTAGMMLFEIPTGVVADTWGRRVSYLLGTITLAGSTLLYYLLWVAKAPFWEWAVVSMLLGLGFTFFSGAVEAWLVDALHFAGYDGGLESVLGRGQMVGGIAMLGGSVAGGVIAQATSLGVPFLLRVGVLLVMFVVAWRLMHDLGFTPDAVGRARCARRRRSSTPRSSTASRARRCAG